MAKKTRKTKKASSVDEQTVKTDQKKYPHGCHPNSLKNLHGRPWKPGQSGNPAGRPKGRTLTDYLRDMAEGVVTGDKQTRNEKLAEHLMARILKQVTKTGKIDWEAFRQIFGRIDPMPTRVADEHDDDDGPRIIRMPFTGGPGRDES